LARAVTDALARGHPLPSELRAALVHAAVSGDEATHRGVPRPRLTPPPLHGGGRRIRLIPVDPWRSPHPPRLAPCGNPPSDQGCLGRGSDPAASWEPVRCLFLGPGTPPVDLYLTRGLPKGSTEGVEVITGASGGSVGSFPLVSSHFVRQGPQAAATITVSEFFLIPCPKNIFPFGFISTVFFKDCN